VSCCYFTTIFKVGEMKDLDALVEKIAAEVQKRLTGGAGQPISRPTESSSPASMASLVTEGVARLSTQHGSKDHGSIPFGSLAKMIDHTLLKPDATADQIRKACEEAVQYGFATVCVNSSNVGLAAQLLAGTPVKAIAVVGFPLGASTPRAKAFETLEALRAGAQEVDMVINIGALKSKDYKTVFDDIKAVVEAAGKIPVKVILETSNLDQDEKIIACALSKAAGAAFVKTSTGFAGGGATVEDIRLMRRIVGSDIGVKASGGVRTTEDAQKMVEAGANRIGASASVAIVTGQSDAAKKGY